MKDYKDCETCKHCGKCSDEFADNCWSNDMGNYEPMPNCENCKHFYECDNMGYFENCLPDMKDYEEGE